SRCRSIPTPRRSRRSLIRAYCTSTYRSQRRLRRSSKRSRSKKAKANQEVALGKAHQHTDLPHPVRLLRARRQRPRHYRAAERSQQFPPSDGDCHTPLPREVRKRKNSDNRRRHEANSWSKVLASFRSSVSKPSVNQP